MPIGTPVTDEEKARILKMKAQHLTHNVMVIRTGLSWNTIYRILREAREQHSRRR